MSRLTKRAYDERILQVDLSNIMRGDDTVLAITSVESLRSGITISNITKHDTAVSFKASGGESGNEYGIRIRFTTTGDVEQQLEAIEKLYISFG